MRYLMNFSYDGSTFNGYEKQPNLNTIQGNVEECLSKMFNRNIKIHASSRTDKQVHAINQYAHFDLDIKIDENKMKKILNKHLDNHIHIKNIIAVDESFHARYSVIKKEYKYIINLDKYNPLLEDYMFQYNKKLNIFRMKKSLKCLIGEHDFRPFASDNLEKANCIRNIYKISLTKKKNKIIVTFVGNGFLKHMIRNIMGCLVDIGSNKKDINYLKDILNNKTKRLSKTVPGTGLYLNKIYFKEKI